MLALLVAFGSASSAQAAITHPYTGTSIGPEGVGKGSFENTVGVAVQQSSGDVFVLTNGGSGRIYKFTAAGAPVDFSSTKTNVIEDAGSAGGGSEEEIALDESKGPDAGDIYVADNSAVKIFAASGAFLGELSGGEMCGVAVGTSGEVYVGIYPSTVRRYAPTANPVTNTNENASMGGLGGVCNVAVDGSGDVYTARYSGEVTKYDALQFGSMTASGTEVDEHGRTLTVDDASNDLFVNEANRISQYDTSVEPPTLQGTSGTSGEGALGGSSFGIAVDHESGKLYVGNESKVEIFGAGVTVASVSTEGVTNITGTEATLHGTVEPSSTEVTNCAFEYGETEGELIHSAPCQPTTPYTGTTPVSVTAHVTGLSSSTSYYYRLDAGGSSASVAGVVKGFTTKGPIINSSGVNPRPTSATAEADIYPEGEATTYHVEYGTSTAYGSHTENVELEASEEMDTVVVHIKGLQPNTTYHLRFVATNASGTAKGEDHEFTTPDIVTQEAFSKVGSTTASVSADINPIGQLTTYEVEYGTSVEYGSRTSPVSIGDGEETVAVESHLAELQPGTVYHFRFVSIGEGKNEHVGPDLTFTTHALAPAGLPDGRGYEMVTPVEDESSEPYSPIDAGEEGEETITTGYPVRAAANGEAVSYVGAPTAGGNGNQGNGGGNQFYAHRNAGGGWTQTNIQPPGYYTPFYWAFSPDLEYAVLNSTEPLTPGAPEKPYADIYVRDNASGSYQPLFEGNPPNRTDTEFGSATPSGYVNLEDFGQTFAGASAYYKHLLFEANDVLASGALDPGKEANNLYESFDGTVRTVNVLPDGAPDPDASFGSAAQEGPAPLDFDHVISSDGSRIFWSDVSTSDLYVRENNTAPQSPVAEGECTVSSDACTVLIAENAQYVTASADGSRVLYISGGDLYEDDLESATTRDLAPGGEVLGVAGTSENLEYVYFMARAAYSNEAVAGQSNLYLLHDEHLQFIASLGTPNEEYELSSLYPQANTNGEDFPWEAEIGHRTAEATPDGHDLVFMSRQSFNGYDNVATGYGGKVPEVYVFDADAGTLTCASCDPTGDRPSSLKAGGFVALSAHPTYQLRFMSEDGSKVFFESTQPLVPQAQNGKINVYEWERDGSGSCEFTNGCVYLISTGSSPQPSYFIDASASGDDVFIMTRSQLVQADQNDYNDIYDARIGAVEGAAPTQCTGTGCQGAAATPPVFATPASVTYNGVGNFAAPPPTPAAKPKAKPKKKAPSCKKTSKKTKAKKSAKAKPAKCKAKKAAKRARRATNGRGGR